MVCVCSVNAYIYGCVWCVCGMIWRVWCDVCVFDVGCICVLRVVWSVCVFGLVSCVCGVRVCVWCGKLCMWCVLWMHVYVGVCGVVNGICVCGVCHMYGVCVICVCSMCGVVYLCSIRIIETILWY